MYFSLYPRLPEQAWYKFHSGNPSSVGIALPGAFRPVGHYKGSGRQFFADSTCGPPSTPWLVSSGGGPCVINYVSTPDLLIYAAVLYTFYTYDTAPTTGARTIGEIQYGFVVMVLLVFVDWFSFPVPGTLRRPNQWER